MAIKTRFLIISDTHGQVIDVREGHKADVVIHCGDLTEESKMDEFRATIHLLRQLPAPIKLVIAGNHDLTLDEPTFARRLSEAPHPIELDLVLKNFGRAGQPQRLFDEAKDAGIIFLNEGNHEFVLENGAALRVYASPFTPSQGGWAFNYPPGDKHAFAIGDGVHVVVTHGPPLGIMDYTDSKRRAGCPQLFGAIARAKPLLHCFGHIHEGWGSKLVTWRDNIGENPSHFTDIDNDQSVTIDRLSNLVRNKFDDDDAANAKAQKALEAAQRGFCSTSHCSGDTNPLHTGRQTLFVNASIEGRTGGLISQPPWLVDIELPETAATKF
ncbi:hypothetical protein KJ359_011965 [Pestalotiopsis sp. 9143b]|nr:hypothetical protein KJ359_011965 [Pestalotiopsis sp. 9143b]